MRAQNYPMAYVDMVRALLDAKTDAEIALMFQAEADHAGRARYVLAREAAMQRDSEAEKTHGKWCHHWANRANVWRRMRGAIESR